MITFESTSISKKENEYEAIGKLTIKGVSKEIKLPFTVEFDITRNILTSANVCQIRVFNLSEKNRNLIRKNVTSYNILRKVSLLAGYGNDMSVIFAGDVSQAWSVREGTNFITQIESFDGGFAFVNGNTEMTVPAGTEQKEVLKQLAKNLPGVTVGKIGNFPGKTTRGNSVSGNTMDNLKTLTGGGAFVDNGKLNCLGMNECLRGSVGTINSASGLLGTPVREQTIITFDMLFEPGLIIGQVVNLESSTDSNFNGRYKIVSIKHRGMISESVSGDAITTVGLFAGTSQLTEVTS